MSCANQGTGTEKITVGYKPIAGTSLAYHKYIVYENENGDKWIAEIFPQWNPQAPHVHDWEAPSEVVIMKPEVHKVAGEGENEKYKEKYESRHMNHTEVIAKGEDLSGKWKLIEKTIRGLEGHPYDLHGPNSNSAVDTALHRAGLCEPLDDDGEEGGDDTNPGERPAPGSGDIIPPDPTNPGNPGDPGNPGNPGDPGTPQNPNDPTDPGDSGDPDDTDDDGDPASPGDPDETNDQDGGDQAEEQEKAGNWLQRLYCHFFNPPQCPLVVDLDGDGLELTSLGDSAVLFDLDGDGFAEHTGWVKPDDGLLAIDRNGNGRIDDGTELFGGDEGGFTELDALDTNDDGKIDSKDTDFANLRIWQDANQDGKTQDGELQTLTAAGIQSINLTSTESTDTNEGHEVRATGTVTDTDGTTRTIADVWFENNRAVSEYIKSDGFEYAEGVRNLPYLRGFGTVADLHIAMSQDTDLKSKVTELIEITATQELDQLREKMVEIVLIWSGADETTPGSRGSYINAQYLEALEAFAGQPFQQLAANGVDYESDPDEAAADLVEPAFENFIDAMLVRVLAQSAMSSLLIDSASNSGTINEGVFWGHPYAQLGAATFNAVSNELQGDKEGLLARLKLVAPEDILVTKLWPERWTDEVVLTVKSTGEKFLLTDLAGLSPESVGSLTFSDGTVWTVEQTLAKAVEVGAVRMGTAGEDTLEGTEGADYLEGREGDDTLEGGSGSDTYRFTRGDGIDTIEEEDDDDDVNELIISGYTPEEVKGSRSGTDGENLTITFEGSTDSIEIIDFGNSAIDKVTFEDGSKWDSDTLKAKILHSMKSTGTVQGTALSETYEHSLGDGSYTITEVEDRWEEYPDRLKFTDVDHDDVSLSRSGDDVVFTLSNSEAITLKGQMADTNDTHVLIEHIEFSDGTVWTADELRTRVFDAMKSTGAVLGTAMSDIYEHALGDGSYTITEVEDSWEEHPDRLKFGDVDPDEVTLSRSGDDVVLTLSDGEAITLKGQMADTNDTHAFIEHIEFSDGTVWTAAELRAQVFDAMKSTGAVLGTAMGDTYEHALGDGSYTITEIRDWWEEHPDRLKFTDVDPDDVTLSRSGDDVVLTLSNNESVTLKGQMADTNDTYAFIEHIEFSDGTVWTAAELRTRVFDAMKSTGAVLGTAMSDTYEHALGDGSYTITEIRDWWEEHPDRLKFTDVEPDDVTLSRSGDDVVFTLSNDETVTLKGQMADTNDTYAFIEHIEFSDGTVWTAAQLRTKVFDAMKSTGGVLGTAMDDSYEHALGDGSYTITEVSDKWEEYPDTLEFTDVDADEVTVGRNGGNAIIRLSNGESVTLAEHLSSEDSFIESIVFADATTWTRDGLRARVLEAATTSGDDTIVGFDSDDAIKGGGGNDTLDGGAGDDTLEGGAGTDTLTGGDGEDTFVFKADDGTDTIADFEDGSDTIEFEITGLAFSGLTITADGDDALIAYDGDDTIRVQDTDVEDLTASDFVFA